MRAFAPGKMVLTGAYAVLEGAPSICVAVSRGALADASRTGEPTPEVRAATDRAPWVDASAMFEGGRKLGLGASAAILVASLAALETRDLAVDAVRADLFARAFAAHAAVQSGGSGVDIATSVYGGAVRYVMGEPVRRTTLPGVRVHAFACGTSARTTSLRAAVDALRGTPVHAACMGDLVTLAHEAARATDAAAFVGALRRTGRALARLGVAAGVAIVPDGFEELEALAARENASFTVSGAGGGDVAAFVGPAAPSPTFVERAGALGLSLLELSLDHKGVRSVPAVSAFADAACAS